MATLSGIDVACPACGDAVPVTFGVAVTSGGDPALAPNWATYRAHMATHETPPPDPEPNP